MSETSQLQYCAKCGAVLSGYAADRLCAACLLESAILEPETSADARAPVTPLLAFNDYELLEEIARGGMGVVYRARQISLNRTVAIKMILGGHLANAAEMKRFRAEAETAAQLQHPNIVAIHEVGEHAGQPFFSMDLVAGRNLAQLVRDEPLPSRKAASYLQTIAEAIQYAHSRGVLHRDLKPSNILIDENDQPRITDFGLAKRLTDSQPSTNDPQLTQTGQVLGSPSFIPPEQAAGQKLAIGPASDVYSLGAILYHCLTGRPPFVSETLTQTLRMVAEQEPVPPRLLNASVPRDLETVCLKCLEKDSSRRYPAAQTLADDLNRFLRNESIQARPVSLALKVHRWCVRNKPLAIAGTAILVLLLVVAIGSPIAAYRIERERRQAQSNEKKAIDAQSNEIQQRQLADAARANEATLRIKAQRDELAARRRAYAADMLLCQQDLSGNNLRRARLLLERQRPAVGEEDLRGWEWRYLWRRCQGDALFKLNGRGVVGLGAKFADGDTSVVTYAGGGQVGLWSLADKQKHVIVQDFGVNRNFFFNSGQLDVSSDGEWIAAAGRSATGESVIRIWETSGRAPIGELSIGKGLVCSLAMSPDKRWMAVSLNGGKRAYAVYSIQTKHRMFEFSYPPHINPGGSVAFSPDGSVLALGGEGGRVRLVTISNWEVETVLEGFPDGNVIALAYSPDGRFLAVGAQYFNPLVLVWDVQRKKKAATLSGHRGYITSLIFSPDGKLLASASADQTIKLWNTDNWKDENTLIGHTDEVWSVAFSSDGKRLVSAGKDGFFCMWLATGKSQDRGSVVLPPGFNWPDVSADGELVAGIAQNGTVRVLELATLQEIAIPPDLGRTNGAAFWVSADELLVCSQTPVQLKTWKLSENLITTFQLAPTENQVARFNYFPAQRMIALTSFVPLDKTVTVRYWDIISHRELLRRTLFGNIKSLLDCAFSHDGEWIAMSGPDGLRVWNLKAGTEAPVFRGGHGSIQGLALLTNPPRVATGSLGGPAMTVWDIVAREVTFSLEGHNQVLRFITASPKSDRLVTSTIGREPLRLWDTITWNELLEVEGPADSSLSWQRFLCDGNTLAATQMNLESGVRQVRLWRAPSWEEIRAAETKD